MTHGFAYVFDGTVPIIMIDLIEWMKVMYFTLSGFERNVPYRTVQYSIDRMETKIPKMMMTDARVFFQAPSSKSVSECNLASPR